MRLSTEAQLFVAAVARAPDLRLTLIDDESEFSDVATREAADHHLVSEHSYGAWDYRTEYKLTNEGRAFVGLPPAPSLLERISAFLNNLLRPASERF